MLYPSHSSSFNCPNNIMQFIHFPVTLFLKKKIQFLNTWDNKTYTIPRVNRDKISDTFWNPIMKLILILACTPNELREHMHTNLLLRKKPSGNHVTPCSRFRWAATNTPIRRPAKTTSTTPINTYFMFVVFSTGCEGPATPLTWCIGNEVTNECLAAVAAM